MLKELINFTESLNEDFKTLGSLPKEGLHIRLKTYTDSSREQRIDIDNIEYEMFSKKQKTVDSEFLNQCKQMHQNAWCIDTNKCFDLPTKAIHTCSPFAVAFKREHLIGGAAYDKNARKTNKTKQIYERFGNYFKNALSLLEGIDGDEIHNKVLMFQAFFVTNDFSTTLLKIENDFSTKRTIITQKIDEIKEQQKNTVDKGLKEELKVNIATLEQELLKVRPLEEKDYILFYLDLPIDVYKQAHRKYLGERLFIVNKYNTSPDRDGKIYGASGFMSTLNGNMPFLMHQTAPFDISNRISNIEAQTLYDLLNIFPNRTLPNPLPIFIYKEEIQRKVISIFRESEFKFSYKEIIQTLFKNFSEDISNYYLLFWQNTKDGIVFKDFDFVSKFEYLLPNDQPLVITNLFDIIDKEGKKMKQYPLIQNVFDFERQIFKPLIQNKYFQIDYFGELNKDAYSKLDFTFCSFCKYRKAIYDYIYKSQKQTVDGHMFDEMVFNAIKDDIRNNNDFGVKEKLNIWYSLYDNFNIKNKINMVNKLKEYQDFVAALIVEESATDISDEKFAFAAGQVIEYILSKSKSADNSHNLLEPYLQQSKCAEFKRAIANDFARYKHEHFSKNFEKVAAFVLSYETSANLKHLLPQILSGVFSKNQLFSNNSSK